MNNCPENENNYTNLDLYNCCSSLTPPNWDQYEHLTVEGCIKLPLDPALPDAEYEVLGQQDREDAEFFTIYGWNHGSHAITDAPCVEDAIGIVEHLSKVSGLQYRIQC